MTKKNKYQTAVMICTFKIGNIATTDYKKQLNKSDSFSVFMYSVNIFFC